MPRPKSYHVQDGCWNCNSRCDHEGAIFCRKSGRWIGGAWEVNPAGKCEEWEKRDAKT